MPESRTETRQIVIQADRAFLQRIVTTINSNGSSTQNVVVEPLEAPERLLASLFQSDQDLKIMPMSFAHRTMRFRKQVFMAINALKGTYFFFNELEYLRIGPFETLPTAEIKASLEHQNVAMGQGTGYAQFDLGRLGRTFLLNTVQFDGKFSPIFAPSFLFFFEPNYTEARPVALQNVYDNGKCCIGEDTKLLALDYVAEMYKASPIADSIVRTHRDPLVLNDALTEKWFNAHWNHDLERFPLGFTYGKDNSVEDITMNEESITRLASISRNHIISNPTIAHFAQHLKSTGS